MLRTISELLKSMTVCLQKHVLNKLFLCEGKKRQKELGKNILTSQMKTYKGLHIYFQFCGLAMLFAIIRNKLKQSYCCFFGEVNIADYIK